VPQAWCRSFGGRAGLGLVAARQAEIVGVARLDPFAIAVLLREPKRARILLVVLDARSTGHGDHHRPDPEAQR